VTLLSFGKLKSFAICYKLYASTFRLQDSRFHAAVMGIAGICSGYFTYQDFVLRNSVAAPALSSCD
jgi:hypothetical protein